MRQISLFTEKHIGEFGGSLFKKQRIQKRPINISRPLHLVFKSEEVLNMGSFIKYQNIIEIVLFKYAKKWNIKIYDYAICSNHIHMVLKARNVVELKSFLRVFSGQTAFQIQKTASFRIQNFWSHRPYSKVLSWGQQLERTLNYVLRNRLEAQGWIHYKRK